MLDPYRERIKTLLANYKYTATNFTPEANQILTEVANSSLHAILAWLYDEHLAYLEKNENHHAMNGGWALYLLELYTKEKTRPSRCAPT